MVLASVETRPQTTRSRSTSRPHTAGAQPADSRFDRQLAKVLEHAAHIFCDKGYEGASMRDLSRATGLSLAGLIITLSQKKSCCT